MKYICLGYYNKSMDARPKAEIEALMRECRPYIEDLHGSGQVIIDAGLHLETTSVRTVKGRLLVTNGPFVETKEQLGGVFIVEAKDLKDAIALASKHPGARLGEQFGWGLEIRPLHSFKQW